MSKEYRIPENIKPQDLVRGIVNASYWHWKTIDEAQHTEAIKYLNDIQIDKANPSEALEDLKELHELAYGNDKTSWKIDEIRMSSHIKQALIKAQEQEKENAYIEKIKTMMKQKDCVLRYIESEDCFAVKTILSDGWYKLTPDFVNDNVREEIKPLPLIEKNKQLREENAQHKRVLEIIKEKNVNIGWFKAVLTTKGDSYDCYLYWVKLTVGQTPLTEEEFDLLKEWLG